MTPANENGNNPCVIVIPIDHINGLQPARALARHRIPVVGIGGDPGHYCARTTICERMIFTDTKSEALIYALEDLGPQLHQRAVILPCTDMHVLLVSQYRERLEPWYHIVLPSKEVIETLMVKSQFYGFAEAHGLPIPRTHFLHSLEDARRAARELRYPCVMKPPLSADPKWEESSKLKAYLLHSSEEALAAYRHLADLADMLILQEWIVGPITNLYSCNCYFNANSEPLVTFVTRKLRQWPPDTGEGSLAESCMNGAVVEETLRLFRCVDYVGLGYLEVKRDARDGRLYIVEPNVGRPTGRSVTAEAAGVEILYTMYCDALGRELPKMNVQRDENVKWIFLRRDLQSAVYHWRRGELSVREWLGSLRGVKVDALFSWKDPGPFWGDLTRAVRMYLSPEERRKHDYTVPLS
jgi:D-aspartate ligase